MHYIGNGRLSQVDCILGYSKVRNRYTTFMLLKKKISISFTKFVTLQHWPSFLWEMLSLELSKHAVLKRLMEKIWSHCFLSFPSAKIWCQDSKASGLCNSLSYMYSSGLIHETWAERISVQIIRKNILT